MGFSGGAVTLQAKVALLFLVQHFSSCRRGAGGTEGPDSTERAQETQVRRAGSSNGEGGRERCEGTQTGGVVIRPVVFEQAGGREEL